jgi:hypothetical protein
METQSATRRTLRFDLDDLGAKIRNVRAHRTCEHAGEIDDANSLRGPHMISAPRIWHRDDLRNEARPVS